MPLKGNRKGNTVTQIPYTIIKEQHQGHDLKTKKLDENLLHKT